MAQEVDYKIYGGDIQFVEIELDPNETVIAEPGALLYMHQDITFDARMGDGSKVNSGLLSKVASVGKRMLANESIFLTHFTNSGSGKSWVALAAPHPGRIMGIDLDSCGGSLICQKESFLAAAYGTEISITLNKRLGAGFFGGEGFILQKLIGNGNVFIHAGGTMIELMLDNETLRVDTGCLVAFESTIEYDIQTTGSIKSMVFGGEGLFLATLSGTGRVWLQSMPFSKLANQIISRIPQKTNTG
jgi:uncharacterized protein (TIGR00266 family)